MDQWGNICTVKVSAFGQQWTVHSNVETVAQSQFNTANIVSTINTTLHIRCIIIQQNCTKVLASMRIYILELKQQLNTHTGGPFH